MFHHRFINGVAVTIAVILGGASVSASLAATGKGTIADGGSNVVSTTTEGAVVPLALSLTPAIVVGGNQTTATITLSTAAPAGGTEITLRSLNAEVARFGGTFAAIGTSQLRIPEGSVSATFPVRTFGVVNRTDVTLQAISGGDVASATVTVNPASPKSLTISPSKVIGGLGATGTVTLDGVAPAGAGLAVQLSVIREALSRTSATNTSTVTAPVLLPSSVNVSPGAATATFAINTTPVPSDASFNISAGPLADGSVRFAASRITDGTSNTIIVGETTSPNATAALTISAPVPGKLLLNPGSVSGGNGSIGTVVLTGQAPSGGMAVVVSAGTLDAIVPSSITIPAGADRQDFKISTPVVCTSRTVTIKAVLGQNNLQQAGVSANLSDGSVRNINAGASIAPAVTANLSVTPTVTSNSSITLTGSGSITVSSSSSAPPLTIGAQPSPATAGAPVAITLSVPPLNSPCPQATSVALTTDHPELLQLPPSVSIPAASQTTSGPQTVIVNATTNAASADQNVTITATGFSGSASTTLLIKQTPLPIASFTLRPTTVTAGLNIIAQLTLSSTAPDSVTVTLTTDHPELVTVPPSVTIARSRIPTTLTLRTSTSTAQTTVTITASTGTQTIPVTVNVVP